MRSRLLRTFGGPDNYDELEDQIIEVLEVIERTELRGFLPLVLLERAGLARLRNDADGMKIDLAEARQLFASMGVTGWDDYAKSIES
jgi:hypothetical protein